MSLHRQYSAGKPGLLDQAYGKRRADEIRKELEAARRREQLLAFLAGCRIGVQARRGRRP